MRLKPSRACGFRGVIFSGLIILLLSASLRGDDRIHLTEWAEAPWTGVLPPPPWTLKKTHGIPDISLVTDLDLGLKALRLYSDKASFALERKLKTPLAEHPHISWRWRVTQLPEDGDFRVRKRDDQAAQLFVLLGKSKAIVYLWDSTAPVGTVAKLSAPPFVSLRGLVVRSGKTDLGVWLEEKRDLLNDYQTVFGGKPPALIRGVRLQINSQHTASVAESFFADLFLSRDGI
jgi:hypothetical protein